MLLNSAKYILLSLLLLFYSCATNNDPTPAPPDTPAGMAPDFTLKTVDNQEFTLSQLKGKVVLLDFWASWCGFCEAENPYVVAAYDAYHDYGLEVVGVSIDKNPESWKNGIAKQGLGFFHVIDTLAWDSEVVADYKVKRIPHLVLIDREGKIVAVADNMVKLKLPLMELLNVVK